MSVVDLQNTPRTRQEMERWQYAHRIEHKRIRDRIQALGGPNLIEYQLEPIPMHDLQRWLTDHQSAHADMTLATNVQSVDLETVSFEDPKQRDAWFAIHYQEHFDVNSVLRI